MSDHSCGYHCQQPECIKAQRDELARRYFEQLGLVKRDYKRDYTQGWNDALNKAVDKMSVDFRESFGKDTLHSIAIYLKAQTFSLEPRGKAHEQELLITALSAIQMLTSSYRKEHGLDGAWDAPLLNGEAACKAINNYLKCL
jgi:hypothetical protein